MIKKIAAIAIVISFILLLLSVTAVGKETITLYNNDTKFTSYPEYPAEKINGEIFVPIYFFLNMPDIQYVYIQSTGGFYLVNNVTGNYISFIPTSTQVCLTGEVFVEKEFPLLNSTRYLPLSFAAKELSLTLEFVDSGTKVRLSDSNAKLSFKDLIELFDPTLPPDDDPPEVIIPPIEPDNPDPPVIVPPEPEDRYIYLTFEDSPNEYTSDILDILAKHNAKAIFFCEEEKIYAYPELVNRISVEGHTLALHTSKTDIVYSLTDTVKEITSANDALKTITNKKSRLWRFAEGTNGNFKNNQAWQNNLSSRGYIVWDWNVDSYDSNPQNSRWNIFYNCTGGIEKNEISYIRFICGKNTARALDLLLDHITANANLHLNVIDDITKEYNFYE